VLTDGYVIVGRRLTDLAACGHLVRTTHLVDRYPLILQDDIDEFLAPHAQLAAWVAVAHDAVVGHVALHRLTSPPIVQLVTAAGFDAGTVGVISRLMVDPGQRGHGLGMGLLDTASGAAHQRRLRPVLDVVTTYTSANQLYQRAGWQQIGVAKVAMPNGAVVDGLRLRRTCCANTRRALRPPSPAITDPKSSVVGRR
jgi:GNAT superfamily N-acetyltransferase